MIMVFWPGGIGGNGSYEISKNGNPVYELNAHLDFNKDGILTRRDTIDRLSDFRDKNYERR